MEAHAAADPVRGCRGAASARATSSTAAAELVAAAAEGARRASSAGSRARSARMRGACPTATGSPNRSPGRSPTPGRSRRAEARIGEATPERRRRGRPGKRRHARQRLHARPRGPVLPHLRRARRRPARTSSTRASTRRATAWRSTICWCSTAAASLIADRRLRNRLAALGRGRADQRGRRRPLPASAAAPAAQQRVRGRALGRRSPSAPRPARRSSRSTRATGPALLAALAAAIHDCGPPHPFGAYRDLRRARGRRLLSDRAPTARSSSADDVEAFASALLQAAARAR